MGILYAETQYVIHIMEHSDKNVICLMLNHFDFGQEEKREEGREWVKYGLLSTHCQILPCPEAIQFNPNVHTAIWHILFGSIFFCVSLRLISIISRYNKAKCIMEALYFRILKLKTSFFHTLTLWLFRCHSFCFCSE